MANELNPARTFRALRHRNFRLYIGGMAVSLAGTWMQQLAQSWLVYRLTHSEWMLGLTWFSANVPVLLLSPLAGVVADRFPRRRIVLITQAVSMLQAAALALLTLTNQVEVWHVISLAALLGTANAFDIPGRQALFIHLVGKQDLLNAISLNSATFNAARVIGPSLGGVLVAYAGEGACFALNTLSFTAVLWSLWSMRLAESGLSGEIEPVWSRLRRGVAYAWSAKPLRQLLLVTGAMAVGTSPGTTLAPMFADGLFHMGSQGLGLLTGALGLGAVAGTLSLARRRAARGLPDVIRASSALMGLAMLVFAWSPSYWLCLAMMPLIGLSVMRQNAATNTTIQMRIDDEYRGRVMGLYSMMVIGMIPIGSLVSGALAAQIGSRWTVTLGGTLCLACAAVASRERSRWKEWLEGR